MSTLTLPVTMTFSFELNENTKSFFFLCSLGNFIIGRNWNSVFKILSTEPSTL